MFCKTVLIYVYWKIISLGFYFEVYRTKDEEEIVFYLNISFNYSYGHFL